MSTASFHPAFKFSNFICLWCSCNHNSDFNLKMILWNIQLASPPIILGTNHQYPCSRDQASPCTYWGDDCQSALQAAYAKLALKKSGESMGWPHVSPHPHSLGGMSSWWAAHFLWVHSPGQGKSQKRGSTWAQCPAWEEGKQPVPFRAWKLQAQELSPSGALHTWQWPQDMWGQAGVWVGPSQPRTSYIRQDQLRKGGTLA